MAPCRSWQVAGTRRIGRAALDVAGDYSETVAGRKTRAGVVVSGFSRTRGRSVRLQPDQAIVRWLTRCNSHQDARSSVRGLRGRTGNQPIRQRWTHAGFHRSWPRRWTLSPNPTLSVYPAATPAPQQHRIGSARSLTNPPPPGRPPPKRRPDRIAAALASEARAVSDAVTATAS